MKQKVRETEVKAATQQLSDDNKLKEALKRVPENKFLSWSELGLTERQHAALIETLHLMESGQVKHVPVQRKYLPAALLPIPAPVKGKNGEYLFNMDLWRGVVDCGTICCIGGTAEIVAGENIFRSNPQQLTKLFYGYGGWEGDNISDKQAARALRGYLETGATDWAKARGSK